MTDDEVAEVVATAELFTAYAAARSELTELARQLRGGHEPYYEFDGAYTAVHCRCGFYRICESRAVAEAEYTAHARSGRAAS